MSNIFSLPAELTSAIVTDWVEWRDVITLDRAICNILMREEWLATLSNRCIFDAIVLNFPRRRSVEWLLVRDIKVKAIHITNLLCVGVANFSTWFQRNGKLVRSIKIEFCEVVVWDCIAQYCPNVTYLEVLNTRTNAALWYAVRAMKILEVLKIHAPCSYPVPPDLILSSLRKLDAYTSECSRLEGLALQVPNVQTLYLRVEYADTFLPLTICKNLVHLSLRATRLSEAKFISLLSNLQTGLRCLVFPCVHKFTARALDTMITHHGPTLRHLQVTETWGSVKFGQQDGGWIRKCTYLKTLYLCDFRELPSNIINTSIGSLLLNSCATRIVYVLRKSQFPALTTLGLTQMGVKGKRVVESCIQLSLRTLLVSGWMADNGELFKLKCPNIQVLSWTDLDILSLDSYED